MSNRDSLDADLDRWQDEQDEDYIDPADAARERAEYLADQEDWSQFSRRWGWVTKKSEICLTCLLAS